MKEWTEKQSQQLRYKRSDLNLTKLELCSYLDVDFKTLKKLESGACIIKQSIFIKALEFLAKNY
ncbi:hypothetical protein [Lactococcus lactis]|uniref:hypothetical protein n=1 Tax=Lactococcus lactis TaxID=1358 RepID=UPI0004E24EF1|nr:hypothetical protein [Lactococcus lactis]OJH46496.1 transcriptional regulator [Lactococcus lactis subsp. lactis bv. diacetylactis]